MTFEEWLKEKAEHALESAAESREAAPDSWGAAYDCGYSDALNFLLGGLPAEIAGTQLPQEIREGSDHG